MHTWSIYIDNPRLSVDILDEGNNPVGACGSNWSYGYTKKEAERILKEFIAEGYTKGHWNAARF